MSGSSYNIPKAIFYPLTIGLGVHEPPKAKPDHPQKPELLTTWVIFLENQENL